MTNSNRQIGGRNGRNEGIENERIVFDKLNEIKDRPEMIKEFFGITNQIYSCILLVSDLHKRFNEIVSTIDNDKIKDYVTNKGRPIDDKRAADIIWIILDNDDNIKHIGIDVKLDTKNPTQLCCFTFQGIRNVEISNRIVEIFNDKIENFRKYINYNQRNRTWKKDNNNRNIIQDVKDIFKSDIMKDYIIKRSDDNSLYFSDYILKIKNNEIIYSNINDLLSEINLTKENTNLKFNNCLVIKPKGSSNNNMIQITINLNKANNKKIIVI